MADYLKAIIIDYKNRGIILDTNLLVLYIVGSYKIDYLNKVHRVKDRQYSEDDFKALVRLLNPFSNIYITPQILAEFSNLTFKDEKERNNKLDKEFCNYFIKVIEALKNLKEEHITKDKLLGSVFLSKFGFADMSVFELAREKSLPVITDDLTLFNLLIQQGICGINMTHLRMHSLYEK